MHMDKAAHFSIPDCDKSSSVKSGCFGVELMFSILKKQSCSNNVTYPNIFEEVFGGIHVILHNLNNIPSINEIS